MYKNVTKYGLPLLNHKLFLKNTSCYIHEITELLLKSKINIFLL